MARSIPDRNAEQRSTTSTPESWDQLRAAIRRTEVSLEEAVKAYPAGSRDSGDASYLLHGIAQHSAYHARQIALLKKMLPPPSAK